MSRQSVIQTVEKLVTPIIEKHNLELVDITFSKEGGRRFLRIFIDKPGGVTLDDCEKLSRRLDTLLDEADPIPQSYILEVSSPGIERPLKKEKDFIKYIGEEITVRTFQPIHGRKNFNAVIKNADNQGVLLETEEGKQIELLFGNIAKANLRYRPERY